MRRRETQFIIPLRSSSGSWTRGQARERDPDDLRASEAAVDEEQRSPTCVGRWKSTIQFYNPAQPHEEASKRREGRLSTPPQKGAEISATRTWSVQRVFSATSSRQDFFIQKEELTRQLASGSRELNSCLPTQPSKAEKHKQTHGGVCGRENDLWS